jgi:hypothetical protein
MTEDKNPQPQERGFFSSLESAKKQRRAFHIPTAPAAAVRLVQNLNRKGASSTTVQTLPQAHPSIGKDCAYGVENLSAGCLPLGR